MSQRLLGLGVLAALVLASAAYLSRAVPTQQSSSVLAPLPPLQETERVVTYNLRAGNARRNREVTGDVLTEVHGIPASPVDSFCYDGVGSTPIKGRVRMKVDPINDVGYVEARWTDEHGRWTLSMDFFAHPHHPSVLRVGSDAEETEFVILDPVVTNGYLHGNTTAGQPVAPTVFAFVAAWGPATVTLNGEPFDNPLDSPFKPQWDAHLMVTAGIRDDDGTVRNNAGEIYNPMMHAGDGLSEHEDLEFHLVFHDERWPVNDDNFPPPFDFFYHLLFEDVRLSIDHQHVAGER